MKPIAIVGPTATGKTNLSLLLAEHYKTISAETPCVISCDSQLIYQGLDIGTAKPSQEELAKLPHYLIDVATPDQQFNVSNYVKLARPLYDQFLANNLPLMIVGGTGFYLRGLLQPKHITAIQANPRLREQLLEEAQAQPNDYLHNKLMAIDPRRAKEIYVNDHQRLVRALEINLLTGQVVPEVPTDWDEQVTIIGLHYADKNTHEKIMKERITQMVKGGWIDEALSIRNQYGHCPALNSALGYNEMLEVFDNKITLDEAINEVTLRTRQFAKRQMTWFKKIPNIQWYAVDELEPEQIKQTVIESL